MRLFEGSSTYIIVVFAIMPWGNEVESSARRPVPLEIQDLESCRKYAAPIEVTANLKIVSEGGDYRVRYECRQEK